MTRTLRRQSFRQKKHNQPQDAHPFPSFEIECENRLRTILKLLRLTETWGVEASRRFISLATSSQSFRRKLSRFLKPHIVSFTAEGNKWRSFTLDPLFFDHWPKKLIKCHCSCLPNQLFHCEADFPVSSLIVGFLYSPNNQRNIKEKL